jgi:hypothetical protein
MVHDQQSRSPSLASDVSNTKTNLLKTQIIMIHGLTMPVWKKVLYECFAMRAKMRTLMAKKLPLTAYGKYTNVPLRKLLLVPRNGIGDDTSSSGWITPYSKKSKQRSDSSSRQCLDSEAEIIRSSGFLSCSGDIQNGFKGRTQ